MIIKATLFTLVLILLLVVTGSYYVNKEGFEDISNGYYQKMSADLGGAVNTISTEKIQSASTENSTIPKRTDVVPEVSISGSGYDAMTLQQRADLLKDIQKVVRNEILSNRTTTPLPNIVPQKPKQTDSIAQGQDYENSCYKDTEYRCPKNPDGTCPPMPDMTQYIKKDAIPCYGCSLDY